MLISDAKAELAAAALDVNVGYFHDPEGFPGLAHFCGSQASGVCLWG